MKTKSEIRTEKLMNREISQEEFNRQERWETIRVLGIIFGGMLLSIILFKETDLGRAFDALFVNLLYLAGVLVLGFVVVGGVLGVARRLKR